MTIYSDLQARIDARFNVNLGGHTDTEFIREISNMTLTYEELVDLVGELLIRVYALEHP